MEHNSTDVTVVRQQDFECEGPVEISVEILCGRLDVHLVEDTAAQGAVSVQVRPDPTGSPVWSAGLTGLLTWLGGQAGVTAPGDLAAEAVHRTAIDFTEQRLTVRTPRDTPIRAIPLAMQVTAPAGSAVRARSGSADVTVDGVADWLDIATGSGEVRAQRCTGTADLRTGSGDVRLGPVLGPLRVRTGSGTVDVVSLDGPESADSTAAADRAGSVQTGSGNVRLGAVARDLSVRTGSGDLIVVDASAGRFELLSGSGQLRVGIHPGVRAEVDISSGSGQARSDLPLGGPPPEGEVRLRVRARTGSGNALVTAAPS
ncbi:MAG TPA: hypothetical protein VFQ77_01810 [Pseudonocardiaceae bacterium]|nr:hypothetical protein [Pseudonocardiaceae bacterium]